MAEIGNSSSPEINSDQPSETAPPPKKKRNVAGMPDPDAEVIALSPKTLMATNRFVCEICNKGFQRDQNLQLHRRGHNLPWKLRQRNENEVVRKRVYVCPKIGCVHHHPSRALGDLTGIKKHFCRKHGEKTYKCDRCSKAFAVQCDRKAHMKTCGTRKYGCECGSLFTRRDSFITHRAFCDVLEQESVCPERRHFESPPVAASSDPATPPLTPSSGVFLPALSMQSSVEPTPENQQLPTSIVASNGHFRGILSSMYNASIQQSSSFLHTIDPISLSLYTPSQNPALSATALLQKASQVGSTTSSFLCGPPSDPDLQFGDDKPPPTLDFLGLGIGGGQGSSGGFTAFLSSINMAAPPSYAGESWDEPSSNGKRSLV